MDSDLLLVIGIGFVLASVGTFISAFSASRPMRVPVVVAAIGGALILWAVMTNPQGYRAEDVPDAVLRVVARIIR